MKSEHAQLSCEAHDCVDSIPELNKMVFAVQQLGMFELQNLGFILVFEDLSCIQLFSVLKLYDSYKGTNGIFLQLSSVRILK